MATSAPVVEKVTRTRVIPATEAAASQSNTLPDFWDYIESLEPADWANHVVYMYREDPKDSNYTSDPSYVDKFSGTIELYPGGPTFPMKEREVVQHVIKEKHGGKAFRLICKKGVERVAIGKCVNGAQPKYPDANAAQQFRNPLPNAGAAQSSDGVAIKAMDTIANQNPQLLSIAIDAVRNAADIVAKHQAAPPAQATTSMDDELNRALRAAMLQKFLAPPPDPIDTFLKIKTALGDGGGMGGTNTLLEKILSTAVDKMLNPAAAVTGRTTLLDLGREFIPVLGTTVRETMHEYRLSVEANARIAELQRGMAPQQPVPAVPPAIGAPTIDVQPQTNAQPAAAPQAAANPQPAVAAAPGLTFPQIEAHIAKIVKNVEYPVDEAVDRVLSFLYDTDGRLVAALLNPPSIDARLKPGKEGLLMLFTYEPALQPCMTNVPRVSEFLDKFIAAATEAEATEARLRAAAPGATAPAPQPAT